jgi:hypothetical protein
MTAAPGDFESFWPAVDEAAVVRSQDPEFVSWQAEPACASCSCGHTWCENLSFFSGLDGSKQPQDLGVNAHMGARTHVNLGIPICKDLGIGAQIGTAMGYHDFAVGAVEAIQGSRERFQSFTTAGVFQRAGCWKWGIAYDFLSENYYEGINLGQWRGVVAGKLTPCDELGAWFTMSDHGDSATFLTDSLTLEPISQVNVYWRRTWATGAETSFWVGAAEPHGEEIILFAPASPTGTQLVYGADIHAPLNDRLAILGEANFITPSDSGTVDAYLGMVYYPWGDAQSGRSRCFAPALPVASNPTFSVDLRR